MVPRELLGTARVPGGEDLRLFRRGADFMIVLDRNELMNSRMSGSEEALAVMTIERLARPAPHLLIGGYGMGFTLRAALAALGPKARVTVAELVPEIIQWARGPMAELTAGALDDPRVSVRMGDVADAIFPEAMRDLAEFEAMASAVDVPILANMTEFGKSELFRVDQLRDAGVRIVIWPVSLLRIAMGAAGRALDELTAAGNLTAKLGEMQHRADLYDLVDYEGYTRFDSSVFDFTLSTRQNESIDRG